MAAARTDVGLATVCLFVPNVVEASLLAAEAGGRIGLWRDSGEVKGQAIAALR